MKIGIDARFYGPYVGGGGLGRYVKELLDHLQEIDDQNHYIVFLTKEGFDAFEPTAPNVEKRLADVRWYTLKEQLLMPHLVDQEHLDLIHYPHWNVPFFSRTPFLVTIHDLILLDERDSAVRATTLPRPLYWIKRLGYRFILRHALFKSQAIITPSVFVRERIKTHAPALPSEKLHVIHEGGALRTSSKDADHTCVPSTPYLLYVGNAYPHKNLESLLHAFSFFHKRHPDVSLVLTGRDSVFYDRLKKELEEIDVPKDAVLFTGFVDDATLAALYEHATLYVFPSKHEGFGLPPLEAMAYEVPVAASRTTSLPEILGEGAAYFDPTDLEDMIRVMEDALSDTDLRNKLIQQGTKTVARYSWATMAKSIQELYLRLQS